MSRFERIATRSADLGDGMSVRRALPTRQRRLVGAWCFLDHLGPVDFPAGSGMHVGAHPHTALQTFTWLIDGEVLHRDSLGSEQVIRPGQVNLMTAGRGIVHTEDSLAEGSRLHAAQLWIALPAALADCPPAFEHYPELPRWEEEGCAFTLLAGSWVGYRAPARLYSPLVGLDLHSTGGAVVDLPLDPAFEYGVLPMTGSASLDGEPLAMDEFAYLPVGGRSLRLQLSADSRVLLLGGMPFSDPVVMWWNFVGTSKEAIATAQREWEAGGLRFSPVAGGDGRRLVAPPLPWATS